MTTALQHSNFPQWRDGWFSHKQGVVVDDNPYNPVTQKISHEMWLSGWCDRCSRVKHNSDVMDHDEIYQSYLEW